MSKLSLKLPHCISCSVVCKLVFCSEFPDIPDNAGKVTRTTRRRRRTQAKRYAVLTQTQKAVLQGNLYYQENSMLK